MTETSQYTFDGPLAKVTDPRFFRHWMDDDAYVERLVNAADSASRARKLVAVEFQRDLARVVASNRIVEDIDAMLERYLSDDYGQHDAQLGNGREPLAGFFKGAARAGIDLWPPMPICVMNEGEIVALLLQFEPKDGAERYIPTQFRVRDGKLCEHWSAAAQPRK